MSTTPQLTAEQGGPCAGCTPADALEKRVLTEILRFRTAQRIEAYLTHMCREVLHLPRECSKGLLPASIFEGCHTAAVQHLSPSTVRRWVHPVIDTRRRAPVVSIAASDSLSEPVATRLATGTSLELTGVELIKGDMLGVLHAAPGHGDERPHTVKVPLRSLELAQPEPAYVDELIPALEFITPHRASKNMLDLLLSKLCGSSDKLNTSFHQKQKKAWRCSDEATYAVYLERRRLWELKQELDCRYVSSSGIPQVSIEVCDGIKEGVSGECCTVTITIHAVEGDTWFFDNCMECSEEETRRGDANTKRIVLCTSADGNCSVSIPLSPEHLHRLRKQGACPVSSPHFNGALAALLLRYLGLCGGLLELESGWHAAVPPSVMAAYVSLPSTGPCIVAAECFASPFNAQLPLFFSAFPDTDAFFGSLGNIFVCCCGDDMRRRVLASPWWLREKGRSTEEVKCLQYRLEANPPFDHEIIAASFRHAIGWLDTVSQSQGEGSSDRISFLFVLPDSSRAHGQQVRKLAEECRYCRFSESVQPHLCKYVHGGEHWGDNAVELPNDVAIVAGSSRKRRREGETDNPIENACSCKNARAEGALVTLTCPTRVIVLQDDASESVLSGVEVGKRVLATWEVTSMTA